MFKIDIPLRAPESTRKSCFSKLRTNITDLKLRALFKFFYIFLCQIWKHLFDPNIGLQVMVFKLKTLTFFFFYKFSVSINTHSLSYNFLF